MVSPTIQFTISRIKSTNADMAAYRVYLIRGAPPLSTRTLVTTINSISTTSYGYTDTVGTQ